MSKSRTAEEHAPAGAADARPGAGTPAPQPAAPADSTPEEIGGRKGPDPTRFGDWEINGRCVDF